MRAPSEDDLPAIAGLLAASGLPTDDLAEQDLSLFLIEGTGERVEAVGGLERCGEAALLRSVATAPDLRGKGRGRAIVGELETTATSLGIRDLYLLTESAERYFRSLDYIEVDRREVPGAVRDSRQFSTLCPDTATVMWKRPRA